MRQALCGFLFVLGACAGSQAGPPANQQVAAQRAGAESAEDSLLRRALAPIAEAVIAEGYRERGPLERGFLAPSARLVRPFVLEPRACVAVIAIASASIGDLDAAIYAPDGTSLAEDETTGARPVVRLCSGEQRVEGYLAFYAFQGTGSFAAMRLERPLGPADALALAEVERQSLVSEQTPAFAELLRGLHARGYEDEGTVSEVPLIGGSAVRLAVQIKAGQCYGVVADGRQLSLRLLDALGRELALGVGELGPASLQYCAPEDAELALELSTHGSERSARLARLHAPQATVGAARATWLGEPSPAFALGALNAKEPAAALRCEGPPGALLRHAALSQGALLERELSLSGCARLAVELHEGLSVVTLRVEDEAGKVLATHELLGPRALLQVCAERAGMHRLTVVARAGFGALSLTRQTCSD